MIYRLHRYASSDGSEGFEFFGSRREAEAARAALVREHGYEREDLDINESPTPRTKAEVLRLLRWWACHPDNG